jgi:hypothetical protein
MTVVSTAGSGTPTAAGHRTGSASETDRVAGVSARDHGCRLPLDQGPRPQPVCGVVSIAGRSKDSAPRPSLHAGGPDVVRVAQRREASR